MTIYLLFLIFLLTKIRWHCKMKTIIVDIIINHANPRPPSEPSWSWSYGSWIYNYLCNQFLSPLIVLHMWVRKPVMAMCTRYNNIKFPHLDSNIPAPPAYEVFISQLINYATFEFRLFTMLQYSNKLLSHRFLSNRLILSFKTFFGRYQYSVEKYSVSCVQMTRDGISKLTIVSLLCLTMALYTI